LLFLVAIASVAPDCQFFVIFGITGITPQSTRKRPFADRKGNDAELFWDKHDGLVLNSLCFEC
jgi:hypothetical protein